MLEREKRRVNEKKLKTDFLNLREKFFVFLILCLVISNILNIRNMIKVEAEI